MPATSAGIRVKYRERGRQPPRPRVAAGAQRASSAAAAEAAGAAVSQIFLAGRACRGGNGRQRREGQNKGENNLRHRGLLLHCAGGRTSANRMLVSVPGAQSREREPFHSFRAAIHGASARGAVLSC